MPGLEDAPQSSEDDDDMPVLEDAAVILEEEDFTGKSPRYELSF